MIKPIVAGKRTDFPDSPAFPILQIIFPVAISTITPHPNNRLLFQNAIPNNVNERGMVNTNSPLYKLHSPVNHSFSNVKNSNTSLLTTSGLGNQNILVNKQKIVMAIPGPFFWYAKKQKGIRKSGRMYQLS